MLGLGGPAMAAGNFYCCVDANGKQVCGDLLPQSCYGRAYRELGPNGQTLRNIEAPLTAEQLSLIHIYRMPRVNINRGDLLITCRSRSC